MDHFDPRLAGLGDVGSLWAACQEFGAGCLLPEVKLVRSGLEPAEPQADPERLGFLVSNVAGPSLRERLARLAVAFDGERDRASQALSSATPSLEESARQASDRLNGRILLGLAAAKFWQKLFGRGDSS